MIYEEMLEQYASMKKCAVYLEEKMGAIRELIDRRDPKMVAFIGCGSSFLLAQSMADTVNVRLNKRAAAIPAGELAIHADRYAGMLDHCLLVPISRSGSTTEIMMAIRALKEAQCAFCVLGVTCKTPCELNDHCELSLELPWCFDESVCQTRTVSCLYYSAMYVIAKLAGDEVLSSQLLDFPELGDKYMHTYEAQWKALADQPWNHAVVLADAEMHGLAREGALAFKEVCQLPSNCYHVLDVRHGPMVLIREKTLVIAAITGTGLENALVDDLVGHGAVIATCTDMPIEIEGTENFFAGAPLDDIVKGLLVIVACQMIAYYKSMVVGTDPDHPDGLDAWIKL